MQVLVHQVDSEQTRLCFHSDIHSLEEFLIYDHYVFLF